MQNNVTFVTHLFTSGVEQLVLLDIGEHSVRIVLRVYGKHIEWRMIYHSEKGNFK